MSSPTNPTPEKGNYQIMPDHTPQAYAELKAMIADHGLQQALVYDQDGNQPHKHAAAIVHQAATGSGR